MTTTKPNTGRTAESKCVQPNTKASSSSSEVSNSGHVRARGHVALHVLFAFVSFQTSEKRAHQELSLYREVGYVDVRSLGRSCASHAADKFRLLLLREAGVHGAYVRLDVAVKELGAKPQRSWSSHVVKSGEQSVDEKAAVSRASLENEGANSGSPAAEVSGNQGRSDDSTNPEVRDLVDSLLGPTQENNDDTTAQSGGGGASKTGDGDSCHGKTNGNVTLETTQPDTNHFVTLGAFGNRLVQTIPLPTRPVPIQEFSLDELYLIPKKPRAPRRPRGTGSSRGTTRGVPRGRGSGRPRGRPRRSRGRGLGRGYPYLTSALSTPGLGSSLTVASEDSTAFGAEYSTSQIPLAATSSLAEAGSHDASELPAPDGVSGVLFNSGVGLSPTDGFTSPRGTWRPRRPRGTTGRGRGYFPDNDASMSEAPQGLVTYDDAAQLAWYPELGAEAFGSGRKRRGRPKGSGKGRTRGQRRGSRSSSGLGRQDFTLDFSSPQDVTDDFTSPSPNFGPSFPPPEAEEPIPSLDPAPDGADVSLLPAPEFVEMPDAVPPMLEPVEQQHRPPELEPGTEEEERSPLGWNIDPSSVRYPSSETSSSSSETQPAESPPAEDLDE